MNPFNGAICPTWNPVKSKKRRPNEFFFISSSNITVATLARQLIVARRGIRCFFFHIFYFYCFLFAWMMRWDWILSIYSLSSASTANSATAYTAIYLYLYIFLHYKCLPLNQLFCNERTAFFQFLKAFEMRVRHLIGHSPKSNSSRKKYIYMIYIKKWYAAHRVADTWYFCEKVFFCFFYICVVVVGKYFFLIPFRIPTCYFRLNFMKALVCRV